MQAESGYRLHSKDCDMEWKSLQFDIRYNGNGSKKNVLHMTMCIGWPSCEAKVDNSRKMQCCVKECVSKVFGIKIGNG